MMPDAPPAPTPADADFAARTRDSFARQAVMQTLGAELAAVAPGRVAIRLAHRPQLTQQHGFLHAGIVATGLDSTPASRVTPSRPNPGDCP